jgi:hypothetical protein
MIDTVEDPNITVSDSVNKRLSVLKGFKVLIMEPEVVTNGGVKVKNGFDTYYIHVVAAKDIFVDGAKVKNRGERTFLAISAHSTSLKLDSSAIESRALFLKGLVLGENPKQKGEDLKKRAERSKKEADSIKTVVDSTFMPELELIEKAKYLRYKAEQDSMGSEAYAEFSRTGFKGNDVARFFLSRYFARSEDYNGWTHPYGLPEIIPAEKQVLPVPKKKGKIPKEKKEKTRTRYKGGKWYR